MPVIYAPFTEVECPVCGVLLDRRLNKNVLAQHLQSQHSNKPRKSILEALCSELKLSLPANITKVDNEQLEAAIENLCQYKATIKGLNALRRVMKRA